MSTLASAQTLGPLAARRAAHAERQGRDLTVEAMAKQCWRGRLRRVEERGFSGPKNAKIEWREEAAPSLESEITSKSAGARSQP